MSRSPYKGSKEALVLGIDIGSTSSSVSIAHLSPGSLPSIRTVTSWPFQPLDSKLPSLVGFAGNITYSGAELAQPSIEKQVANGRIKLCKFFKLHLHPQSLKWEVDGTISSYLGELNLSTTSSFDIVPDFTAPPLPSGVSIERVYSVFLAYLVEHAQAWFEENTLGGDGIWRRLSSSMDIVMGIPDGWDEHQCEVLKKAIVASGIIGTKEEAEKRTEFLRESEASVHFALESEEVKEWMKAGIDFTVADLGGSTCDTCMYHVDSVSPKLVLREVKPSDSVQAGGVYVDRAAQTLIESKLNSSRFKTASTMSSILTTFERQTKRQFHGGSQTSIIKFGGMSDTDLNAGIRSGRMTLSSAEVAATFKFCKDEIIASVKSQIKMGSQVSRVVVMTGGFGESEYLHDELSASLESFQVPVVQCTGAGNKPVAEGLLLWHLARTVGFRSVRRSYGTQVLRRLADHPRGWFGRPTKFFSDGNEYVTHGWSADVQKGTIMATDAFWESGYCVMFPTLESLMFGLFFFSHVIYEYTGKEDSPQWMTNVKGVQNREFRQCCTIIGDLSGAAYTRHIGAQGVPYWEVSIRLRIFVAQTTLKAQLVWEDSYGRECEGPATAIVFEADTNNTSQVARRRAA